MIGRLSIVVLAALCEASAWAQTDTTIVHTNSNNERTCTVRAFASGGAGRGAGIGFARIEIENFAERAQPVTIELTSPRWESSDVRSRRSIVVEPRGRASFFLPVPVPPMHGRLVAQIGGVEHEESIDFGQGNGVVGLLVADRSEAAPDGLTVLQAVPSIHDKKKFELVARLAAELPSDWRMFTAYSAVVVDGRAAVGGDLQEALCRLAFAGGKVIVAGPELLPAGRLRDLATRQADGLPGHGFGFVVAIAPLGADPGTMRARLAGLPEAGSGLSPVSRDFFCEQEIAGLGRAPVTVFVLVILLFAIVVGPVNFWFLRKRKQPLMALLTVPMLGFGTTFVILMYGIFHDGFAVRGAITSWTVLDQARHEVGTVATRTLFAGLAPNDLTMTADSMLLSYRAGDRSEKWPDRWHWNADSERLDGGVLPSRTVTPLVTLQQGTARQRLTVRRVDDDTLEVLGDGGIEPIGVLVLQDLDGQFWRGEGGRLRRITSAEGRRAVEEFVHRTTLVIATGEVGPEAQLVPQLAPRTLLMRGTYVAQVASAPWLDEHGISVSYDHSAHYVYGRMHAQDFVR